MVQRPRPDLRGGCAAMRIPTVTGVKVADIDVSNVQTPTPNACAAFRRRTVSPFDPTDFDAS